MQILWGFWAPLANVRRQDRAEGVGFEPTRECSPLPVFKTGALNHSATLPYQRNQNTYGLPQ
jgi:hypothetical protein